MSSGSLKPLMIHCPHLSHWFVLMVPQREAFFIQEEYVVFLHFFKEAKKKDRECRNAKCSDSTFLSEKENVKQLVLNKRKHLDKGIVSRLSWLCQPIYVNKLWSYFLFLYVLRNWLASDTFKWNETAISGENNSKVSWAIWFRQAKKTNHTKKNPKQTPESIVPN